MATQAEIAVLRGTATQVKNESQVGGNTAGRVGGLFEGIVDALPSDEVIDGKISEAVADIQPIVIEGNVDNAPDQEDLTSVNQGGTDVLKFKDKTYSPALFSGLGRVYLRKNVVTPEDLGYAINLLTAEMVSQPNIIYHIQYDYDLNGQTITLPANVILQFDGGSLANGTLVGANTRIIADETTIFKDVIISSSGTWDVETLFSRWFYSSDETVYSTIDNLLNMNNEDISTYIYIRGDYDFVPTHVYDTQSVKSNTTFYVEGTITNVGPQGSKNLFDFGANAKNISFYGGTYIGNLKDTDDSTTPNIETGHCFMFREAENILFDGCTIRNFTGDGICASAAQAPTEVNTNITIRNCVIDRASRNGITIICAKNIIIENCTFHNITRKAPRCAIDVEPNFNTQPSKNISIKNCLVDGCTQGFLFSNTKQADISDVNISNCLTSTENTSFIISYIKNVMVENSQFTESLGTEGTFITLSNNVLLVNNKFSLAKGISNSGTKNLCCINNTFTFSQSVGFGYAEGIFEGNTFEVLGALFQSGTAVASGHRQHFVLKNNVIKCKSIGFQNTQNMTMEGNKVSIYDTSDVANYFIQGSMYDKESKAVIRDNVFDINASTRHIQFWPACNLDISNNIIKVANDKPIIYISSTAAIPAKNNTAQGNTFILPDRFVSAIYNGLNTLASLANKAGDIVYFDSIKKYATFNGSKWVDENGFTAALSHGTTAERPANLYGSDNGFQFFDSDLGKPIYNKVTIGTIAISKVNIAKNEVDGEFLGVTAANTLTQGENYKYETTIHTSRWFKAAFRKTDNSAYDDADEILICESKAQYDHVFFKAPDPSVYPYVYYCNRGDIGVTSYIKNVTMEWVDATGTAV